MLSMAFTGMNICEGQLKPRIEGWGLSRLLRFQRLTWRVHIEGLGRLKQLYSKGEPFLLCFWHGKYVPILPLFEGYKACVITSLSDRGDVIAEICRHFGYQCMQIPDHGRDESLRLMERTLSGFPMGGIAVDGPLGPYHKIKRGVIQLASALDFSLLPVSVDARRKRVFRGRWDLMEIPRLFTKIFLLIGDPIKVPAIITVKEARDWVSHLTDIMLLLDKKASSMARGKK